MLHLPSDMEAAWFFALLFFSGGLVQLLGLWWRRTSVLVVGAVFVCCAAWLDRDPVLAVGQLLVTAALWPLGRRKEQQPPQKNTRTHGR